MQSLYSSGPSLDPRLERKVLISLSHVSPSNVVTCPCPPFSTLKFPFPLRVSCMKQYLAFLIFWLSSFREHSLIPPCPFKTCQMSDCSPQEVAQLERGRSAMSFPPLGQCEVVFCFHFALARTKSTLTEGLGIFSLCDISLVKLL